MPAVTTDQQPTAKEQQLLEHLRRSLYEWALGDIKKAASPEVNLPVLAFVGLAAWIDTLTLVFTGGKGQGKLAWTQFIDRYVPEYKGHADDLLDGFRNTLLHEYGTSAVALTHADAPGHWAAFGELRLLELNTLIRDFEAGFERYYADLQRDPELWDRASKRIPGLLAPVTISPAGGAVQAASASTSASYSSGMTTLAMGSPTAPPEWLIKPNPSGWQPQPTSRPTEKPRKRRAKRRRRH